MRKTTFALYFGNRGFMPAELIASARQEMAEAVKKAGYAYIEMDEKATRYGAVETRDEGRIYHDWLLSHQGEYDGVILCMPIFVDENGAITALRDAGVPILMQAYPDDLDKMDFANRRDAFCGKFSVTDVFTQYGVPFTVLKPHVVKPLTPAFASNLRDFAAICQVVRGMKRFTIGCLGARTTAFKTTRFDELALEKYGITVETFDMSDLFYKVQNMKNDDPRLLKKAKELKAYADFSKVPDQNALTIAKLGAVIDDYVAEYHLDAVTIRCWSEMQTVLRVCPCTLLSEMNNRGIVASCEVDLCSAITMRALNLASQMPAACLDWNNNYGDDENKVILFHCGPVANGLMTGHGQVIAHKMFEKVDPGSGWGCDQGKIKPNDITLSNCQTKDGKLKIYTTEGRFTADPVAKCYFGTSGVAEIPDLQNKLIRLARGGFKHHTTIGVGHLKSVLDEAFTTYLNYDCVNID
jgi:L-fucose isomerase-like protein